MHRIWPYSVPVAQNHLCSQDLFVRMSHSPRGGRAMKRNRPDVADTVTVIAVLAAFIGCSHVRKVDHSVDKLAATLKDSDADMRYWAAESLGHYGADAKTAV